MELGYDKLVWITPTGKDESESEKKCDNMKKWESVLPETPHWDEIIAKQEQTFLTE